MNRKSEGVAGEHHAFLEELPGRRSALTSRPGGSTLAGRTLRTYTLVSIL